MTSGKIKVLIDFAINFIVGLVLAFFVMLIQDIFNGEEIIEKLCNGFFVSSVVMLCVAALRVLGRDGQYDSLSYIGRFLNPFKRGGYKKYSNYKEEKTKKREEATPKRIYGMLMAGSLLLVISIIFYIIEFNIR